VSPRNLSVPRMALVFEISLILQLTAISFLSDFAMAGNSKAISPDQASISASASGIKKSPETDSRDILQLCRDGVAEVKAAKDTEGKKAALRKLRDDITQARDQASLELVKLRSEKQNIDKISLLSKKESLAIRVLLAFEFVFEDVLSEHFRPHSSFRQKSCNTLPSKIRFDELVNKPAGYPLSEQRRLALEVLAEFCGDQESLKNQSK
jgi:hypothetical protein